MFLSLSSLSIDDGEKSRRPTQVEVMPAILEDQPVLANLLELYIHDFSEFLSLDLGADGRFVD
jgi:hypothetical protein